MARRRTKRHGLVAGVRRARRKPRRGSVPRRWKAGSDSPAWRDADSQVAADCRRDGSTEA